jgi:hypothetical protein
MRRNPEGEGRRWLKQAQEEFQDAQRLRADYYDDEAEALEAERMAGAVIAFVQQKLAPGGAP